MTPAGMTAIVRSRSGLRRRHGACVSGMPDALNPRSLGHRVRTQAARCMGDTCVGDHPGRFRRRWQLADPDRNAKRTRAPLGRARLFGMACLQEAARNSAARMGQQGPGGDARENHCEATGVLGRWHSRSGLRLGGHGAGDGGVQQASGRAEGYEPGAMMDVGVPRARPPDGGRLRRRPRAVRRTWRTDAAANGSMM